MRPPSARADTGSIVESNEVNDENDDDDDDADDDVVVVVIVGVHWLSSCSSVVAVTFGGKVANTTSMATPTTLFKNNTKNKYHHKIRFDLFYWH